jgi:hypothetical protein
VCRSSRELDGEVALLPPIHLADVLRGDADRGEPLGVTEGDEEVYAALLLGLVDVLESRDISVVVLISSWSLISIDSSEWGEEGRTWLWEITTQST